AGDSHIWDGVDGHHIRAIKVGWQRGMSMSPDGRYLAWAVGSDSVNIRLYDLSADKFVEPFPAFKGESQDHSFTADGKSLISVDLRDGVVRWWNVESGKEQKSFQAVLDEERKQGVPLNRAAISSDGSMLAVASSHHGGGREIGGLGRRGPPPDTVRLWDISSG